MRDLRMISQKLPKVWKQAPKGNKEFLIVDPEKAKNDAEKNEEEITMEVIRDIADSMDDMIKFTVDYPGNHKS